MSLMNVKCKLQPSDNVNYFYPPDHQTLTWYGHHPMVITAASYEGQQLKGHC